VGDEVAGVVERDVAEVVEAENEISHEMGSQSLD
jgi:hypothetical protein